VAIVGYTNAGKSTLFNRLTGASVVARDQVFETLDPTMREVRLTSGRRIILSDTVGFISNLPTTLVAAFRATLEEVMEADLILHVRDISHPETQAQLQDVDAVLSDLGIDAAASDSPVLEVWNKADRLDADKRAQVDNLAERHPAETRPVLVSALSGEGTAALAAAIERRLGEGRQTLSLSIDPADGAGLSWLYRHSEVLARDMGEDGRLAVTVRADPKNAEIVRRKYAVAP